MIALDLPWLEIAILLALLGAVGVNRVRDPQRAARWGQPSPAPRFSARSWPGQRSPSA